MTTQRDATVQLRETSDWRAWHMQLQNRAAAYNIWSQIDPTANAPLQPTPKSPDLPELSEYSASANVENPRSLSDLTAAG